MKKTFISCFIILNILSIIKFFIPKATFEKKQSKFLEAVYLPISFYQSLFTLHQNWLMFAPNPGRRNEFVSAEIEFMDGSKDTYDFPGRIGTSSWEKYKNVRYRKIIGEGLRSPRKFLWADTARFVLRKTREKNYSKIPIRVNLLRHVEVIPDLSKEFRLHGTPAKKYKIAKFYTHEVI